MTQCVEAVRMVCDLAWSTFSSVFLYFYIVNKVLLQKGVTVWLFHFLYFFSSILCCRKGLRFGTSTAYCSCYTPISVPKFLVPGKTSQNHLFKFAFHKTKKISGPCHRINVWDVEDVDKNMFAACSLSDPQGVFPFSNPHGDEPSNNQFHILPCLAFIHFCCSFKTFLLSRANSKFLNRFWMVFGKLPFQNSNWCGFAWFRELWEQRNCVYFQRRLKAFRCRQEPNSHQQVNLPHNPK